eukprot:4791276-Amphidinium_carterae.1
MVPLLCYGSQIVRRLKYKALAGLRSEGASITRCCSCAFAASPGVQLCILYMGLDFRLSLPAMCRCSRATPFPPPLVVRTGLLRLVEAHVKNGLPSSALDCLAHAPSEYAAEASGKQLLSSM